MNNVEMWTVASEPLTNENVGNCWSGEFVLRGEDCDIHQSSMYKLYPTNVLPQTSYFLEKDTVTEWQIPNIFQAWQACDTSTVQRN